MLTIAEFARDVLGKPLYPYQLEVAEAILASVQGGLGRIITVMMARQAGKNQLSATLEAYLLSTHDEGTIIKAAPTFSPQIATSHERPPRGRQSARCARQPSRRPRRRQRCPRLRRTARALRVRAPSAHAPSQVRAQL